MNGPQTHAIYKQRNTNTNLTEIPKKKKNTVVKKNNGDALEYE